MFSSKKSRPTIGFVGIAQFGLNAWDLELWRGAVQAAQTNDVNLIFLSPFELPVPSSSGFDANALLRVVNANNLDGLVVWSGGLVSTIGYDAMQQWYERHQDIPTVCIGQSIPGVPEITIDNYTGMRQAIEHLIKVHGYRQIAFLRGPVGHTEAEDRYRAYTDALEENNLPVRPELVAQGDFVPSRIEARVDAALTQWLDDQHFELDAIVTSSDEMAFATVQALLARKLHVPQDLAVVGFDDMRASFFMPPLTTVRQPMFELGQRALELVLKNKEIPEKTMVSAELVTRQSCGCLSDRLARITHGLPVGMDREVVLTEMARVLGASNGSRDRIKQVYDGFVGAVQGEAVDGFLHTLGTGLQRAASVHGNVSPWYDALAVLRRGVFPTLSREMRDTADTLLDQAWLMATETTQNLATEMLFDTRRQALNLQRLGKTMVTAPDQDRLLDVLVNNVSRSAIPRCSLVLYDDDATPHLVLACDENGYTQLVEGELPFPAEQLLPDGHAFQGRHDMIVQPLYNREQVFGYTVSEYSSWDESIYETLRLNLTSAIERHLLIEQVQQHAQHLEAEVAARTKELREAHERLQRESKERARLQQEIIETQRLSILELSSPVIPLMEGIIAMPLIGSIDTERAQQIMRELLSGISRFQAQVVILDVTGVPIVDTGVAQHLHRTVQAARLKGARTVVTGISEAIAETIVDLGIDWINIETVRDLQTGLIHAMRSLGKHVISQASSNHLGLRRMQ